MSWFVSEWRKNTENGKEKKAAGNTGRNCAMKEQARK